MQARAGASISIVAVVGMAAAGGCLPRGEPPRGQQLVPGRRDNVVLFQASARGEPARLLTLRQSATPGPPSFTGGLVDVFVVSGFLPVGGQTRLEPLFESAAAGSIASGGPGFETDARGRLFFLRAVQGVPVSP